VQLGAETARLRGTAVSPSNWQQSDAFVRGTAVVVRDRSGQIRYQVPHYPFGDPVSRGVSVVGSKQVHGYLCLIRFHEGEPAVGLVGVTPGFMGEAPVLALLAGGAGRAQYVPGGFDPLTVVTKVGPPVIMTGDMRFFEVGGSDSDSGYPLRVFTVTGNELVNVSRSYPLHMERDAAVWWRRFQRSRFPFHGGIAAWAADECTLGRQAFAFRTLDRLQAAHRLRHYLGGDLKPAPFAPHLERLLRRTGYAR
jgi:hypothetical protein